MPLYAHLGHARYTLSSRCLHTRPAHLSSRVKTSHMACQMQRSTPLVHL